jgi:hemoglobin/transferrin/lactoferrin receptor protein
MPRLYALGFSSSNRMGAARLELAGLGNGFDMLIGANYRTADNYDSPAGEVPNSDFRTRSLTARVGYSPNATSRIELNAKKFSDDAGRAGAPGAPLVITREDPLKERFVRLAYSQNQVAPWMQDLEASLYARNLSSILRGETHTASNGTVEFRNTWVKGPLETGGKLLARSVIGNSVLSYGFDAYRENAPPFEDDVRDVDRNGVTTFVDPRAKRVRAARQTDLGALAHYDWDPSSRLTVSLGGRYDSVRTVIDSKPALGESPELTAAFARNLSARDSALTGSAGVIFRPMPELHLVGNISTAFRSPTTGDKSGSGIVGALNTLPNAELKPEKSVNYEAGVRVRLGTVNANLTMFRSNYKDLVQFAFLNPTTRQRVNLGRVNVDGFELDGAWQMTKSLAFHFNAANARGTNELTHTPLSFVPPLNGLLAVRHTWNDVWLEVADRWSKDKTRIDRTQERPTDGYQTLNIYSGFDLSRIQPMLKSYRLNIGIENLTDKAYVLPATRELIGFPVSPTNPLLEPGRSLTINLTATF